MNPVSRHTRRRRITISRKELYLGSMLAGAAQRMQGKSLVLIITMLSVSYFCYVFGRLLRGLGCAECGESGAANLRVRAVGGRLEVHQSGSILTRVQQNPSQVEPGFVVVRS